MTLTFLQLYKELYAEVFMAADELATGSLEHGQLHNAHYHLKKAFAASEELQARLNNKTNDCHCGGLCHACATKLKK